MRPAIRLQAAAMVFATALGFYWITVNLADHGFLAWYRLARDGRPVTATITAVRPDNHAGCSDEYRAQGRTLRGHDCGCSRLGVGGTLQVTYLPDDPTFATNADPMGQLEFEIFDPLALACVGALVAAARFKPVEERPR